MARHNLRMLLLTLYVVLIMLAFQFACTYRARAHACCGVAGAITGHPMSIAEPPPVLLLYRAILTLHALPDPDLRYFVDAGSSWPEYPRRYLDAYNPDEELDIGWQPTPHDVTTYLRVLAWARELSKRQWHIMVLRARDYSLPLIADMLRLSLEHVVDAHGEAVQTVSIAARTAGTLSPQNSPADFPARINANIWCAPLDTPPQNARVSRSRHCVQNPVVFSFADAS